MKHLSKAGGFCYIWCMKDIRYKQLAQNLVKNSIKVNIDDNVLIDVYDLQPEMIVALVEAVTEAEGNAFVKINSSKVIRSQMLNGSKEYWRIQTDIELKQMKKMQCYIAIRAYDNAYEYSDIPSDKMGIVDKIYSSVTDYRCKNTRWCVLRFPTSSMAQGANMSTESFEDLYFKVCLLDYSKMKTPSQKLIDLMNKTDKVRIVAKDTDLTFSIKNIPVVACIGEMNIPDGEVFTAPVKNSVEGVIHFNTPTIYNGKRFTDIRLIFEKGKIVEATSSDTEGLNAILDTDKGSRYVGEFALGFNPYVTNAICDILFDEKIAGSFHFTPGACYDEASNGNKSSVHWDMVLIQTPEYGGGEIWFDDVLIRKEGIFVIESLKGLNPTELLCK